MRAGGSPAAGGEGVPFRGATIGLFCAVFLAVWASAFAQSPQKPAVDDSPRFEIRRFIFDGATGRGDSIIQTGLSTFDNSLLSYIIFAAREETRAARFRKGLGGSDDLGAPACK